MPSHAPSESSASVAAATRAVSIAIIDSGVHAEHPHVQGVAGGVSLTSESEASDYVDRIGHGTAVAAAIREKAPDARLYAVKVFDRALAGSVNTLVRALNWAIDNGCDIVNMSLGTSRMDHRAKLGPAVERAVANDVILVAAREDRGQQWLPGCLPGVVGVMVDWDCPRDRFRVERASDGGLICHASGYPREIPGVPVASNLMGISFAVANATGLIACALAQHESIRHDELHAMLIASPANL